jgi:hypothetical protein
MALIGRDSIRTWRHERLVVIDLITLVNDSSCSTVKAARNRPCIAISPISDFARSSSTKNPVARRILWGWRAPRYQTVWFQSRLDSWMSGCGKSSRKDRHALHVSPVRLFFYVLHCYHWQATSHERNILNYN